MSRQTRLTRGFALKGHKVVRSAKHLNVSRQLQIKSSKRVRPARKGTAR